MVTINRPDAPASETDQLEIYRAGNRVAIKGSTWVFKGQDKSVYQNEFDDNPVKAERDFGANPPEASAGALPIPEIMDTYANWDRPDPVDLNLNRLGWVVPPIFDWFVGDSRFNYFLHFDLSKSGDQSGVGLVHYDHYQNIYVADLIMKIPVSKEWNLKFASLEVLIDLLKSRGFYLAKITFDGFQSLNIIQTLIAKGFNAALYSVDRTMEAYDTLISTIFQQRFDYYPQENFIYEMKTIQLKGNKYDHPPKGSKDISDAVAGALSNCVKAATTILLNRENLSELFYTSSSLHDSFEFQPDGSVRIVNQVFFRQGSSHSFYLDSYEDVVIAIHGYLENSVFTMDYLDIIPISDELVYTKILSLVHTFRPDFVGLGSNTSYHIVDRLRDARVRVISVDSTLLNKAANRQIRVIQQNKREIVENLISQIKQKQLKIVDRLTLFNQMSEVNYTNYGDKLLVVAVASWLHYMIQETKKQIGQGVRPVIGGLAQGNTRGITRPSGVVAGSNRPTPKLR